MGTIGSSRRRSPHRTGQPYSVIAFDFDGVIADSMPIQATAWRNAARAAKVGPQAEQQLLLNFWQGASGSRMFEHVELDARILKQLRQTKDEEFGALEPNIAAFKGSRDTLEALTNQGQQLAIATTASRERLVRFLERTSLAMYFDIMITDEEVTYGKPNPEMLHMISQGLKCEPKQLCLVGDTVTDYRMSCSAGTGFLLFESHPEHGVPLECAKVSSWQGIGAFFLGTSD